MKKLTFLKLFITVGLVSTSSHTLAGGIAFGSANASTCEVYGGRDLRKEAANDAKASADKECQSGTFTGVMAEITEVILLDSYRGSCWAGTNSGSTVKIKYKCLYNDKSNAQLIEKTVTVMSCPDHPTDEANMDEDYFKDSLRNEIENSCDDAETAIIKDTMIINSSVGWGGVNPSCPFYRRTKVNVKLLCLEL